MGMKESLNEYLERMGLRVAKVELGDDIELLNSPVDGKIVVVSKVNGKRVCQYCFKEFDEMQPRYRSIEIVPANEDGSHEGTRVKVHAYCHGKHSKGESTIWVPPSS